MKRKRRAAGSWPANVARIQAHARKKGISNGRAAEELGFKVSAYYSAVSAANKRPKARKQRALVPVHPQAAVFAELAEAQEVGTARPAGRVLMLVGDPADVASTFLRLSRGGA